LPYEGHRSNLHPMWRITILYGAALAGLAFLMEWGDYKHVVHSWSTELYVGIVAITFVTLGIWIGNRLAAKPREPYARNKAAIKAMGISGREIEVLEMLAAGHANKVIARQLAISPNTVKTHVARVFEKLEVASRTQAIRKAQELDILP
jgi:DNA-binding CsgD family transcriptional regulator